MFGEVVTRIRRVEDGVDRYGNPTYIDVETSVPGAAFAPEQASQEPTEVGRASVITKPTLYFNRPRPDFIASDRVRVRGWLYEVDGDPADWRSPWGTDWGGLVVALKRVAG